MGEEIEECKNCKEIFSNCKYCSRDSCEECIEGFFLIEENCFDKEIFGISVGLGTVVVIVGVIIGNGMLT